MRPPSGCRTEDRPMAKATKFSSLKAAQDWLVARGFAKSEVQHVWQNGSRMAAVSLQFGGVMPRFLITVENTKPDGLRQRVMASDLHMVEAFYEAIREG